MIRFFQSKIVMVLLGVMVVWLGISALGLRGQKNSMALEFQAMQDKISKLQEDNKVLRELKAYFASDRYLGKEAREKLNYKDPDEKVVFVYPKTASESKKETSEKSQTFLEKFKNWWYSLGSN
ncbi:MAG: septum formation initiator family protein [Candidatus Yanofskybacteria bacterium]|nr:septum formation initiator family protein [Candidatus Yanofskybacteria bacterium]